MKYLAKFFLLFFLIISGSNLLVAQTASVKFEVKVPPESVQNNSSVFLTGSFNCWNPNDSMYIMQKTGDDLYSLVIPVFEGKKYEYKYTLGDWNTVETSLNGSEIKSRKMFSKDGLVIKDTVMKWKSPKVSEKEDTTFKFSKEQLIEMAELKAKVGDEIKAKIKNTLGSLKKAFENMLSEKPDMKLRKKYHEEAVKNINKILDMGADALWKAASILTPEQKKAILNEMKTSKDPGALFDMFSKFMSSPKK